MSQIQTEECYAANHDRCRSLYNLSWMFLLNRDAMLEMRKVHTNNQDHPSSPPLPDINEIA